MLVLNLALKPSATTQYMNYDFNDAAIFNGTQLLATADGLQVCGCQEDTDDDSAIDAKVEFVRSDYGFPNPKRFRFMYFGFNSAGNLEISVSADEKDFKTYVLEPLLGQVQQRRRVAIQRSQTGRYWTIIIQNTDGCNFTLDSVKALLNIRNEGNVV